MTEEWMIFYKESERSGGQPAKPTVYHSRKAAERWLREEGVGYFLEARQV
jgi:hypothetical protein